VIKQNEKKLSIGKNYVLLFIILINCFLWEGHRRDRNVLLRVAFIIETGASIDPTAPFKMIKVGLRAFQSPPIQNALGRFRAFKSTYACRVNSNTLSRITEIVICYVESRQYFFASTVEGSNSVDREEIGLTHARATKIE